MKLTKEDILELGFSEIEQKMSINCVDNQFDMMFHKKIDGADCKIHYLNWFVGGAKTKEELEDSVNYEYRILIIKHINYDMDMIDEYKFRNGIDSKEDLSKLISQIFDNEPVVNDK